ncbi:GTPase Era [Christensenellaceae bacterium OttesenSCG-928-M15]|nr:GTPase Era [Christensenellaceae bacterium OttesenSCG-928-M15]
MTSFKSGFVSIIGCPNVGKSTLLNSLVGQKVAIVSKKAQTTRNRVTGVLTRPGYQIVFLDTPGVAAPKNKLGEFMRKVAYASLDDVEVILYLVDPIVGLRERDEALVKRLKSASSPCIGIINKSDIASMEQMNSARAFLEKSGRCEHILSLSAKAETGVKELEELLKSYLVEGPQFFPDDMYTDQPERMLVAEHIREKALAFLNEEVPHGVGVDIEKMSLREGGELMDIYATIYCERETHKGIIIGKRGSMLKKIGEQARADMEWMLGVRVNLQLFVKVREDWRNSQLALRELGYDDRI